MEHELDQELNSLTSIEAIHASEAFPKKAPCVEDAALVVTFPLLHGEYVCYLGRITEGSIALSNFRLFIHTKETFFNIPLGLIEQVECRDIFFLHVYCKDARSIRCIFSTNEHCLEWYKRLATATAPPKKLEDLFAFAFRAWCSEESRLDLHQALAFDYSEDSLSLYNLTTEADRMGFDLKNVWRITNLNKDHEFCPTYPKELLVPASIKDEDLENVAKFRSSRRIPVVVWRHQGNGSVIARCSQPEVGWLGWRDHHDESLVQAIAKACATDAGYRKSPELSSSVQEVGSSEGTLTGIKDREDWLNTPKVLIVDARSYAAAVANRAKGGGCECPEYYPNCEIQFMSLANIHSIRKSFQSIRALCASSADQSNWFSVLEGTKWLHHMSGLLKGALAVVNAVDRDCRPVLVHCSDGWDRTPQIVALAQLMLDPYYRTLEGFQVLVEREWLEFGHKFGDRCGHGLLADDTNERCPVFLQFLDCVHQLLRQFPCSFEFNEAYLVKLVQHTYSCLFGTFLCNSSLERQIGFVYERSYSVWSFFKVNQNRFRNFLYVSKDQVLLPACHVRDLIFWSSVYMPTSATMEEQAPIQPALSESDTVVSEVVKSDTDGNCSLTKTRSYDDLLSMVEHMQGRQRRSSDPSLMDGKRQFSQSSVEIDGSGDTTVESNGNAAPMVNGTITNGCVGESASDSECDVVCDQKSSDVERIMCNQVQCMEPAVVPRRPSASSADSSENEDTEPISDSGQLPAAKNLRSSGKGSNSNGDPSAFESSTDTLVGELAGTVQMPDIQSETPLNSSPETLSTESTCSGSESPVTMNNYLPDTMTNGWTTKVVCPESVKNHLITHLPPTHHPHHHHYRANFHHSSISTSTSDISDSHVITPSSKAVSTVIPNNMNGHSHMWTRILPCSKCPFCINGKKVPESHFDSFKPPSNSGRNSVGSTPLHSRTPSSGFPATPNDDRLSECAVSRSSTALAHKLDMDGLTMLRDDVQQRLCQIMSSHMSELQRLERELCATRLALYQQVCHKCSGAPQLNQEHSDEVVSLPDSVGSGEHHSLGQESNSDVSWEQVEERDTHPTLWVPDHAVTRCTGCETEFWLGRRKHHCRNCGRIFCADCSNQMVPIPSEQLYDPVRVCCMCFENLRSLRCKPASMFGSDAKLSKPIVANPPTAAASN